MDCPIHCKLDGIPIMPTPRDVSAIDPYCCNMRRDSWFIESDDISATESDFFRPPLDPWRMKYYPCAENFMYGPQPAVEFMPTYPPPFPPPVSRHPPKFASSSSSSSGSLAKAKHYFCPRCFRYGVREPIDLSTNLNPSMRFQNVTTVQKSDDIMVPSRNRQNQKNLRASYDGDLCSNNYSFIHEVNSPSNDSCTKVNNKELKKINMSSSSLIVHKKNARRTKLRYIDSIKNVCFM
ncbi:uncharacterized protein LOC106665930 [Cimex lectularius]|uniref:Uncharacterized protein n=1 Tax=Cimex lectularius TaxID=79782 RepID=A0A8I6RMM5_CIMLE|nr:uncharacterized protein LOC106665930 [Cimex lectularius]